MQTDDGNIDEGWFEFQHLFGLLEARALVAAQEEARQQAEHAEPEPDPQPNEQSMPSTLFQLPPTQLAPPLPTDASSSAHHAAEETYPLLSHYSQTPTCVLVFHLQYLALILSHGTIVHPY